jgi:hypothetical protein
MKCKHQFIKVADTSRTKANSTGAMRTDFLSGIIVVCAECGEARNIYEDGSVWLRGKNGDWTQLT